MAQTYEQVQKQIELLQQRAQKLLQREAVGVIERIKEAIAHYGITAEQLGFESSTAAGVQKLSGTAKVKSSVPRSPKFDDGNGNVWSGRGPRPHWLRKALETGKTLEDFAALATTSAPSVQSKPKTKTKKRKAGNSTSKVAARDRPQYKDDAGHQWSGMGPRPRWLKEAIESGKTLEQLST